MARYRFDFSEDKQDIEEIATNFNIISKFINKNFIKTDYEEHLKVGDTESGVKQISIRELNHNSSFSLLASIEATFKIDYILRVYRGKSDLLSLEFKRIHSIRGNKPRYRDILKAWSLYGNGANTLLGELKGAIKYRDWLAHGRYWKPKMGKAKYDFDSIYILSEAIIDNFPFENNS